MKSFVFVLMSLLTYTHALSIGYKIHDTRVVCNDIIVDKIRYAIAYELNISSSFVSITCDGFKSV